MRSKPAVAGAAEMWATRRRDRPDPVADTPCKFGRQHQNESKGQNGGAKIATMKRGDHQHAPTGLASLRGVNALDVDAAPLERNLQAVRPGQMSGADGDEFDARAFDHLSDIFGPGFVALDQKHAV
jgi:hypothetical protein